MVEMPWMVERRGTTVRGEDRRGHERCRVGGMDDERMPEVGMVPVCGLKLGLGAERIGVGCRACVPMWVENPSYR